MTSVGEAQAWDAGPKPVGPAPGLRYGGFWIRTLAYLLDTAVLVVAMVLVANTIGVDFFDFEVRDSSTNVFAGRSYSMNLNPLGFVVVLAYFVVQWALRGQTFGMAPFRLRILRADDGRPIGAGRALGRFFGLLLAFLVFAIGVIWVAADARKQGWHDKLAGTVVVRPAPAISPAPNAMAQG